MRRLVTLLVTGLVLVAVVACDTEPPSDVTSNAATLNGRGHCEEGLHGHYYYEGRVPPNAGWFRLSPNYEFACTANTPSGALESFRWNGLSPGTTYQYRIKSNVCSRNGCSANNTFDADGNSGSNWQTFITDSVMHTEDAVMDFNDATASLSARRCGYSMVTEWGYSRDVPPRVTVRGWCNTRKEHRVSCGAGLRWNPGGNTGFNPTSQAPLNSDCEASFSNGNPHTQALGSKGTLIFRLSAGSGQFDRALSNCRLEDARKEMRCNLTHGQNPPSLPHV